MLTLAHTKEEALEQPYKRPVDLSVPIIEVVDEECSVLGESIVWDEVKQCLWWVDGIGQKIHCRDHDTGQKKTWDFDEEIGSIGLRKGGGLIVGMRSGLFLFTEETGKLECFARPDSEFPGHRFNDGKADRSGRFWTGTVLAKEYAPSGRLFRVDPDLSAHLMLEGISCVNGLCFSPDNRLMYYSDSFSNRIEVFDYNEHDGRIFNRRLFAEIPIGRGVCDGATVDAQGYFWSANCYGWCVTRYTPRGQVDMVFNLPVQKPTSLCFGGPDLDVLYITTAHRRLNQAQREQQPLAGKLLAVRPGVRGIAEARFHG